MQQSKNSTPALPVEHVLFRSYPKAWKAIETFIKPRKFKKEESVIHHGDPATTLWIVLRGWVKLTRQTPDGKETIVGLCTEGDVFGEAALFKHANYPYYAEIIGTDAELGAISAETIRDIIQKDESLSTAIMSMLNDRVSQAQLKLEHMSTLSAAQRLGCFLLRLCHIQSDGGTTLLIPVEKNILAAYLGMKPETFSRSQQQLKPLDIEISGSTIKIGNIEKLREFVCNSCSESGFCETE